MPVRDEEALDFDDVEGAENGGGIRMPPVLGGFTPISARELLQPRKILIYGDSGVGKTVFCGSAFDVPEYRPVLVLDIEGGAESLKLKYPEVEVINVTSYESLTKIWEDLYRGAGDYKTIVIDTISEAQRSSLANIMVRVHRENENLDPELPRMKDYNKNTTQVRNLVRYYRNLPVNVLFTAHATEEETKDRDGNILSSRVRPMLTKQLRKEIPGTVSMVGYMYLVEEPGKEEPTRCMLWNGTAKVIAKDRTQAMPQVMTDPAMTKVHELVQAKLRGEASA